jgi:hypothetical protein
VSEFEYSDPLTGQIFSMPDGWPKRVLELLDEGAANGVLASVILGWMGEEVNKSNERHLRKAANWLRAHGHPVVSTRSGKGGYFIAVTPGEIAQFTKTQRKLANSMLKNADELDRRARENENK